MGRDPDASRFIREDDQEAVDRPVRLGPKVHLHPSAWMSSGSLSSRSGGASSGRTIASAFTTSTAEVERVLVPVDERGGRELLGPRVRLLAPAVLVVVVERQRSAGVEPLEGAVQVGRRGDVERGAVARERACSGRSAAPEAAAVTRRSPPRRTVPDGPVISQPSVAGSCRSTPAVVSTSMTSPDDGHRPERRRAARALERGDDPGRTESAPGRRPPAPRAPGGRDTLARSRSPSNRRCTRQRGPVVGADPEEDPGIRRSGEPLDLLDERVVEPVARSIRRASRPRRTHPGAREARAFAPRPRSSSTTSSRYLPATSVRVRSP